MDEAFFMVTVSADSRPIIGRGPSLGARFFFLAILSIAVMVLDHRTQYLETARIWMSAALHPLNAVVDAPYAFWNWLTSSFADRARLREENAALAEELRIARIKLLHYEALVEENRRLRELRDASDGIGERTLIAEIMNVSVEAFRHRIRINKGAYDGVYEGQPVIDAFGIVGQVARLDMFSSQVILITDAEHAIPVQVNRNGIRSLAMGTGQLGTLSLPFMTVDADIQVGDLLVSSGFDGIFPAGYPVATVTTVRRNPAETFATVEAKPLALLDRDREVLLLWPNTPRGAASRDASMTDTAAEPSLSNPPEQQSTATPPASQ
nr:rod shape-determining protein MreC [Gammaproteobacteria bacterium]